MRIKDFYLLFVFAIGLVSPCVRAETPAPVPEAVRQATETAYRALYTLPRDTDEEFQSLIAATEGFLTNAYATVNQKSTVLELMRNVYSRRQAWEKVVEMQRRNIALPELPTARRLGQQMVLADILWRRLRRFPEAVALYQTVLTDPALGDGPQRHEAEGWLTLLTEPE